MKKITTLALALALGAGMLSAAPAAAAGYGATLTVNGTELNTAALPAVPAGDLLPLRLVAESDHGSASWDAEAGSATFYLEGNQVVVDCATGDITVNGTEAAETALIRGGVTYVPAAVVDALEGYEVVSGGERIDITTPNNDPMIQLAYQLMETAGMGHSMKVTLAELEEYQTVAAGCFTRAVGFLPMMTSPDTLILGQVSKGKLSQLQDSLETYRQGQEDTFSWYLSQNLPKVQNAQVAVSGDWVLFVIAEHAEEAAEAFLAAAKDL